MTLKIYSVLGNRQKLDGGAMFGNAPKNMWSQWYQPDENNRIELFCRALLVCDDETKRKILFETGIGAFFPPKLKERYGVVPEHHVLIESLKSLGFEPHDITDIVLSHLHFDHAGGLLNAFSDSSNSPSLVFPNAQYFVSKEAFERSIDPHPRDRASFIDGLDKLLMETSKLHLISNSDPSSLNLLGPNISFYFSQGHTPGLLLSKIAGKNYSVLFVSDLIPGSPWVNSAITMGYDRYPELLIDEKIKILKKCVEDKTFLFFTHDPKWAMTQVLIDEKGKFIVSPQSEKIHLNGFDL